VLRYALDVLPAEARQGKPRLLSIGYHLRIAGRADLGGAADGYCECLARSGVMPM
jgi:hypothetical protein